MVEDYFAFYVDENRRRSGRMDLDRRRSGSRVATDGFRCVHCGAFVTREALFSGVINRNHCPYCLHSRHLDQFTAGDRLAFCKGLMRPIGLTAKITTKKYAGSPGELMLVHRCVECGKLSINRIAADDIADFLMEVFQASLVLPPEAANQISASQISLLGAAEAGLVRARLFGLATKRVG